MHAILASLLRSERYILQRYATVQTVAGQPRVKQNRSVMSDTDTGSLLDMIRRKIREGQAAAASSSSYSSLSSSAPSASTASARAPPVPPGTVFVDLTERVSLPKEVLLRQLEMHLRENIVTAEGNFFVQQQGIPQGSVLSALMANIYLGYFERTVLIPALKPHLAQRIIVIEPAAAKAANDIPSLKEGARSGSGSGSDNVCGSGIQSRALGFTHFQLLMRQMDDFLFISTSRNAVEQFLSVLHTQARLAGLNVQAKKTKTNYISDVMMRVTAPLSTSSTPPTSTSAEPSSSEAPAHASPPSPPPPPLPLPSAARALEWISWNGLLIHSLSLNIRADHSRYFGRNMRDWLNIRVRYHKVHG